MSPCHEQHSPVGPPRLLKKSAQAARSPLRRSSAASLTRGLAVAAGLSLAYMAFEAQWVQCRELDLPVPGLPQPWSGLTVLHLSDVHPDSFPSNLWVLAQVVRWARQRTLDLVLLTGDVLGHSRRSKTCLALLEKLQPRLGTFAVTGNHEYGLTKGLLAQARPAKAAYAGTSITLLDDSCVELPARNGFRLVLCGADYLSGGFGLLELAKELGLAPGPPITRTGTRPFPVLLSHEPPPPHSPLTAFFPLVFAGHTHGGQLRLPSRLGLKPPHMPRDGYLAGIYHWGNGLLVVSAGIGTSFLPLRLFTRPEATLWRLVYTS